MSKKANVVIIGAGIMGVSAAYHLAKRGVQDIVLIDKGDLDHNDGSKLRARYTGNYYEGAVIKAPVFDYKNLRPKS